MADTQPAPEPKKSDLGTRALSAVMMVAVAGTALWLGGWWWTVFVAAVALGVLWEWHLLVSAFGLSSVAHWLWNIAGLIYVGIASAVLVLMRGTAHGIELVLAVVASVIAIDVGAYFAGRTIGGPKIAPSISPSKTWAGLGGGIFGAMLVLYLTEMQTGAVGTLPLIAAFGAIAAIVAQAGDFFESWMKRRAGVKDSGNAIPGHGGLFDRVDGLLAVCLVIGLLFARLMLPHYLS